MEDPHVNAHKRYTNIHSDSDFNDDGIDIDTDIDTDIYQVVGGADKRLGSFYVGASAGYARGETHLSTRESFDGLVFDDEFDIGTHNPSFLRMLRTTSMRTSS
ncbi:MAG: hypothetical protein M3461_19955 [Pseudomonadota bacterium]|nr:hypothetical protein [Pseudomonadota bacterium]